MNNIITMVLRGLEFCVAVRMLRNAGFGLVDIKAYSSQTGEEEIKAELIRAYEGGSYYHEPVRTTCCVCGAKVLTAKGTWWLPICDGCHSKGWKSDPYYGDNYAWSVFLDHDALTAYAVEEA